MGHEAALAKTVLGVLLAAGAILAATATGQDTAPPDKDVPLDSCVTAKCHVGVKDYKVVHSPVDEDGCDACHTLTDAASHKFELAEEEEELCASCHELEVEDAKVVHEPVESGNCLACHAPHGGSDQFSLRGESIGEACLECHDDLTEDKKMVHGPVAAGECTSCHKPHAAEHEKLLTAEGNELCFSCHAEMEDQLGDVKFPHEAVEGDCSDCHDPHASDYVAQILEPPAELCVGCHDDIGEMIEDAAHKHPVVTEGDACVRCHKPHGGDLDKLLKDRLVDVCMTCHKQEIKRPEGRAVPDVADVLDPKKTKHGPIKDGSCAGCHNVHGSDAAQLLARPYPERFYAPFKADSYDLCFGCHDRQLVLAKETEESTGFRDGDVNLHYVHVNRKKGRTCRACHSTHTSDSPAHIRDSVPFGKWKIPLNYKPTKSGGSCTPGCHQELGYERQEKPVEKADEPEPPT